MYSPFCLLLHKPGRSLELPDKRHLKTPRRHHTYLWLRVPAPLVRRGLPVLVGLNGALVRRRLRRAARLDVLQ